MRFVGFLGALAVDCFIGFLLIKFHDTLVQHFGKSDTDLISFGVVVAMIAIFLIAIKAE